MAKVTGTSDSHLSGKVGDKVYYQHNGISCVRKVPTIRKDARTALQLMNQQRFRAINGFCRQFKYTLITRIWNDAAVYNTGYRLFLKAISPAFARDGSISDYRLIKLTAGILPLPMELMAIREKVEGMSIRVSWKQDLHFTGERLRDELKFIAHSNGVFSEITSTGLIRRSCGGTFELPYGYEAASHIYLFFVSNDNRDYSDSCSFAI